MCTCLSGRVICNSDPIKSIRFKFTGYTDGSTKSVTPQGTNSPQTPLMLYKNRPQGCPAEPTTTSTVTTVTRLPFCNYPMWGIPEVGTDNRCDHGSCPKRTTNCEDIYGTFGGDTCTVVCAGTTASQGSETVRYDTTGCIQSWWIVYLAICIL